MKVRLTFCVCYLNDFLRPHGPAVCYWSTHGVFLAGNHFSYEILCHSRANYSKQQFGTARELIVVSGVDL